MNRFAGVIPPVVTPFTGGEIDYASLDRVVEHLIEGGVHGLFVLGSTSEVAYLTDAQRVALLTHVVQQVAGRVPVLAGAIDTTAHRVVDQAHRLRDVGADAIVATGPFYALNDAREIADHFRSIHAAIDLPLFAYDVPVRLGGLKLGHDLLVALGKEGVLTGVKDSSGNDVAFRRLVRHNRAEGSPLTVLSGHEYVVDGVLLMGADGVVPGYGNVDPRRYRAMYDAAQARDWERVLTLQEEICDGFDAVFMPVGRSADAAGVGAFKTAMAELGVIASNEMAFPVHPLGDEVADAVREVVRRCI